MTLRVAHLSAGAGRGIGSYVGLLCEALRGQGLEVVEDWDLARCRRSTTGVDVVHLHWLEYLVGLEPGGPAEFLRGLVRGARFLWTIARLRRRGVAVVWTIHNLQPHEPRQPALERLLAHATLLMSDAAIAHSTYARERLRRAYAGAGRIVVIPHGNYVDVYPGYAPAPAERGDDSAFEFLCFGQIRPYKQLPELVEAFRTMDEQDVRLVIAGKPVVADEVVRIRNAAGDDPRVVIDDRMIPAEEVSDLHRAADAAIFAYRDVFSSGALLLALSYGLPVLAPAKSTAAELVHDPGLISYESGGLAEALVRARGGDRRARREAALRSARDHPWSQVAQQTAGLYRGLVQTRRRHPRRPVRPAQ